MSRSGNGVNGPVDNPSATARHRAGIVMGVVCMVLWSTTAALIALGGSGMPPWQFICVTGLISGAGQLGYYASRGKLRGCVVMPWRLWLLTVFGFAAYGLVYPLALITAEDSQKVQASLINYGWPVLTVVMAVLWVPGTRASLPLGVAVVLAAAGLVLANWPSLRAMWGGGTPTGASNWPYVLAAAAAVLWAAYSSLISRWRHFADSHATSPVGFLLIAIVAGAMCLGRHEWSWSCPWPAWTAVAALSLGSYGAGYLIWELALHRRRQRAGADGRRSAGDLDPAAGRGCARRVQTAPAAGGGHCQRGGAGWKLQGERSA